jgi:hypothetical protein
MEEKNFWLSPLSLSIELEVVTKIIKYFSLNYLLNLYFKYIYNKNELNTHC